MSSGCGGRGATVTPGSITRRGALGFLDLTKIRSNSPGGRVNSSDVSPTCSAGASSISIWTSDDAFSFQSRICSRAISAPGGPLSSVLASASGGGVIGAGDSRMLSARNSKSISVSPAVKALGSSARCANALKTSPHFPQRTWPPAARSTSADNLKTVSHLEHCVNKLGHSPRVDAAPLVALNHLHHIKTRRVCRLYCVGLRFQQA